MRRFSFLVLLAGVGCAPAQAPAGSVAGGPTSVTVSTDAGSFNITTHRDNRGSFFRIEAPPEQAWGALVEVYGEMEIPLSLIDRGSLQIGNQRLRPTGRLAGDALARLIECGADATGTPLANTGQVEMSLVTTLSPLGTGATRMETQLQATARRRGTSAAPAQCGTTGRLELRIAGAVQQRLHGS